MAAISRAGPRDGGMVTVEAAVSLCAFVTVLAMVLAGMDVVLDQLRCTDAAREAARLVARGERALAGNAVAKIAPRGSAVSVATHGYEITVDVRGPVAGGFLPGVHADAEAFAIAEPGGDDTEPDTAPDTASDTAPDTAPDTETDPGPAVAGTTSGR
jgi:hypothetical protein